MPLNINMAALFPPGEYRFRCAEQGCEKAFINKYGLRVHIQVSTSDGFEWSSLKLLVEKRQKHNADIIVLDRKQSAGNGQR